MFFFTADQHLNHQSSRGGIIKYCNRPFSSIEEMNETIVEKWNNKVKNEDTVYIAGDFAFSNSASFLKRLNGSKVLLIGDHDKATTENAEACSYLKNYTQRLLILNLDGISITICHWCMRVWAKSHYNSWHLFGHSHGRLEPIGKSWDIGVDCNDFAPVSFNEIKEIMSKRPDNFNLIKPRVET